MFAIVRTGGKQYRVAAGDKITVEKLAGNVGDSVELGDVLLAENTGKGRGDALTLSLSGAPSREFNWNVAYTYTTATEVSPLTSSTANSNWNGRAIFDPNEEVAGRSAYEVRDRVTGGGNRAVAGGARAVGARAAAAGPRVAGPARSQRAQQRARCRAAAWAGAIAGDRQTHQLPGLAR